MTGCGTDISNINKNEIKLTINKILIKHPVCIGGSDFNVFPFGYKFIFPQRFDLSNNLPMVKARLKVYDRFTKVNILNKTLSNGEIVYNLTTKGRNSLKDGRFCYGVKKVSQIINYQVKKTDSKMIKVNYTYQLNEKSWIKSHEFSGVYLNKSDFDEHKATQFLILTTKGWIAPDELNF